MRIFWRMLVAVAVGLIVTATGTLPARAESGVPITNYDVVVNLTPEGVAEVKINLTLDFGARSGHGPYIALATAQDDGADPSMEYTFEYSDVQVSSPSGAAADVAESTDSGGVRTLKIGREGTVYTTPQDYTITYDVTGFIVSDQKDSGLDEFNWNALGTGWTSAISDIDITVTGPTEVTKAACFVGDYQSQRPCDGWTDGASASFYLAELPPSNPVQTVVGFPAGTFGGVEQHRRAKLTPLTAFALTPVTGSLFGVGMVAAILGGVAQFRRIRKQEKPPKRKPNAEALAALQRPASKVTTVSFAPPRDTTPAELGLLLTRKTGRTALTATVLDLAVRGYLRINQGVGKEFALVRLRSDPISLEPFEDFLLGRLFHRDDAVTSEELRTPPYGDIPSRFDTKLRASVKERGWFNEPGRGGLVALTLGINLIAFGVAGSIVLGVLLRWGLVGLPVLVFGIILLASSLRRKQLSRVGKAYLEQAKGFKLYLATAEADTLRLEEGEDIFSKYLPQAVVFDLVDRWTKLFTTLGEQGRYRFDDSWVSGGGLLSTAAFASSFDSAARSMDRSVTYGSSSSSYSSSTSGSSGSSGFSGGGGFGGGGGGSW
ncbi:hypothetical protein BW730_09580 [Tessaracoccus aquimaris]|uniref:DUF2207 domain-containing protein n=1 Tax=Tessaracoccus aquimaris TaxID=1332264 RepID=A0A1Q2CNK8_9ACTN|nr:DUF2207 domain-containing protein [Tessaracoccus aquimaris]AQP47702.1 hypothetical protein BW730_09580 [Tessaracoccus aquimaris]